LLRQRLVGFGQLEETSHDLLCFTVMIMLAGLLADAGAG